MVGGYREVADKTVTSELREMFDRAFEGFTGASYEPESLEATQIVNGTNYMFKARGYKITNPVTYGTYYVYIHKSLQDEVSVLKIEEI